MSQTNKILLDNKAATRQCLIGAATITSCMVGRMRVSVTRKLFYSTAAGFGSWYACNPEEASNCLRDYGQSLGRGEVVIQPEVCIIFSTCYKLTSTAFSWKSYCFQP